MTRNLVGRWAAPGRGAAAGLLAALTLAGCSSDRDAGEVLTRTDSAGVEIVSVRLQDAALDAWSAGQVAMLDIGQDSGPEEQLLHDVTGVALLEGNRVVLANAGSSELRIHDQQSALEWRIGREGDGPGEFRYPRFVMALPQDSVLALRRLTVFSLGGDLGRVLGLGGLAPEGGMESIARVATMEDLVAAYEATRRFALVIFQTFALLMLALAAIGIYGVLAGGVAERTRKIGIRSALGASDENILGLVVGQGLAMTGVGLLIGIVGAVAATRWMESLIFGISRLDPATYTGVAALLGIVALIACWGPARRAARIDPAIAFKAD